MRPRIENGASTATQNIRCPSVTVKECYKHEAYYCGDNTFREIFFQSPINLLGK